MPLMPSEAPSSFRNVGIPREDNCTMQKKEQSKGWSEAKFRSSMSASRMKSSIDNVSNCSVQSRLIDDCSMLLFK